MSIFSKFKITKFIWLLIGSVFLLGSICGLISRYQIPWSSLFFASTYCFAKGSPTVNHAVNAFYSSSLGEHLSAYIESIKNLVSYISKWVLQLGLIGIFVISSNIIITAFICLAIILASQFVFNL